MNAAALRKWVRAQAVCDVVIGPALIVLPVKLFALIPAAITPLPENALAIRLLGLYATGLGIGWLAGWNDPVRHAGAVWASNALRALGTVALFVGASLDPHAPWLLRLVPIGEGLFAVRTARLMARAGLSWLAPPASPIATDAGTAR